MAWHQQVEQALPPAIPLASAAYTRLSLLNGNGPRAGHPERIRKPDALRVRLNYAFRMIYGRRPTDDELKETQNFLASAGPDDQAWPALMRVLLASNEFLTVD